MTQPRLLFDECIGRPHIEQLKTFVSIDGDDAPEIQHILEFQEQGVWDEEWIPRVADEGWIIVTQDRGKKGKSRGTPLPKLCVEYRITHVLLGRRVAQRKSFDKMLTLLSIWRPLLALSEVSTGTRMVVEPFSSQHPDSTLGRLIDRTPVPKPPPVGQLFDPDST